MDKNKLTNAKATKKSSSKKDVLDIFGNISVSKKTTKKITKTGKSQAKAFGTGGIFCMLLALVIGLASGVCASYYITKDDTFAMNTYDGGATDIYIGAEEAHQTYTEIGCNCVAFGQNISKDVVIKYLYREDISKGTKEVDAVDENVSGIYYAVYTTTSLRYTKVTLIRNIIVLGVEVDE